MSLDINIFCSESMFIRTFRFILKLEELIMAGKFVITTGKDGKDYFVLKAGNGEVIMQSQGYKSASGCENGIESVRTNSQDESKFECREAKDGRTYFVLKANNGQEIGRSQMYKTTSGCNNGMASVTKNAADASVSDER